LRKLLNRFLSNRNIEDEDDISEIGNAFKKHLANYKDDSGGSPCDRYDFGSWNTFSYEDNSLSEDEIERIGRGE